MLVKSPAFQSADLSHVKTLFTSGGITSPATMEKLTKHLPNAAICVVYAMTEGGNAVSIAVNGKSHGKLFYNVTVKILDDEGNKQGLNEAGEIWVKFLFPVIGYFNNPKSNENIIDADGFYATGDIGYFDKA